MKMTNNYENFAKSLEKNFIIYYNIEVLNLKNEFFEL